MDKQYCLNDKKCFNLILINAQSLINKLCDLKFLIDSDQTAILCIVESWLGKLKSSILPYHKKYHIFRSDREIRHGGGVLVMVPKVLNCALFSDTVSSESFEGVWVEIHSPKRLLRLAVIYRPPNSTKDFSKLKEFLDLGLSNKVSCLVVGDFNLPSINWSDVDSSVTVPALDSFSHQFWSYTVLAGLQQFVQQPTRKENILDLVFSSDESLISDVEILPPFSTSDHSSVSVSLNLPFEAGMAKHDVLIHNYHKADYNNIVAELEACRWEDLKHSSYTVDEAWTFFRHKLQTLIEIFVPLTSKKEIDKPWSNKCKKAHNKQRKLYWRMKNAKNMNTERKIQGKYKAAASLSRKIKKTEVADRENKILHNRNSNAFWKFVNSKLRCKDSGPALKKHTGELITESASKSEVFMKYFSSVYQQDDGSLPEITQPTNKTLCYIDFSPDIVYAFLHELPNKFSNGPDGLNPYFLKQIALHVALPLSIIFTKSFESNELPEDWKAANVVPVHKKGKKCSVENYRPISLTSVASKVMESIIKRTLVQYLTSNKLISPDQHGFLARHSTDTQLLQYLNYVTSNVDKRLFVDVLYLDFAKAFDTVSHNKLIHLLNNSYGINGNLLLWIKAFLTNRKQRVSIDNSFSEWCRIPSSVVQGSCLGPVLFLLYINHLPMTVNSTNVQIKLFADDTKIFVAIPKESQQFVDEFQIVIDKMHAWAESMQLQLAMHKCAILHIGHNNPGRTYTMNGEALSNVTHYTDLGVTITSDLKFSQHCINIVKNASLTALMILKAFNTGDRSTLVQLFKTYVRSKLEFSSASWNCLLLKDIDLVEGVQRAFTRRLPGMSACNASYLQRLDMLQLQPLELRRLHIDLIWTYRIIHGLVDLDSNDFFDFCSVQNRGHSQKLCPKKCHNWLNCRVNYFSFRVINVWNSLSNDIVNAKSLSDFKAKIESTDLWRFLKFNRNM